MQLRNKVAAWQAAVAAAEEEDKISPSDSVSEVGSGTDAGTSILASNSSHTPTVATAMAAAPAATAAASTAPAAAVHGIHPPDQHNAHVDPHGANLAAFERTQMQALEQQRSLAAIQQMTAIATAEIKAQETMVMSLADSITTGAKEQAEIVKAGNAAAAAAI